MSSCTECHGAEGNNHTSEYCPRFKSSTPIPEADELFRLASLIGCEPEDEERHRKKLVDYIENLIHQRDLTRAEQLISQLPESKDVSHTALRAGNTQAYANESHNNLLAQVTHLIRETLGNGGQG